MSAIGALAVGGALALALVLAAVEWVRLLLAGYRWFACLVGPAASGHGAPRPDSPPIAGPGSGSHPKDAERPPTQEGVDGRGGVGYPARHFFSGGIPGLFFFGVALQPDFDSFFGGFATAVAAGGVVLFAVVVVMAVRRLTSF